MLRQGTAMPIMVECSSCGKQYNAPDSMAGKRVKCKQCGQVFEIPGGQGVGDDLSALSMLEKSFHDGEPAAASVHFDLPKPPKPGYSSDEGEGVWLEPRRFVPFRGNSTATFRIKQRKIQPLVIRNEPFHAEPTLRQLP